MGETSIKIFIGTDAAGKRLKKAAKQIADEKYLGSMSRMFVLDFCEKYGYDRETGKPTGNRTKNRIGYPPGAHYESDLLNDQERKK